MKSERSHDTFSGELRGPVHLCWFKLNASSTGNLAELKQFIDVLKERGVQGVVGCRHDCPIAATNDWTECPRYEPISRR